MSNKFLAASAVVMLACLVSVSDADAMAMDLITPSISIPGEAGKLDPVVERVHRALMAHIKEFTGGHAINASSVLHFGGGTKTVNDLLKELSKIDGITLHIRLSKAAGVTRMLVGERGPCSCSLEHNGWGQARSISLTIYLGSDGIDPDALLLPLLHGR